MTRPVILWLRQDLRLADNPALDAAVRSGAPVVPVYILDEETPGEWAPGGASRWWLHHSLAGLSAALAPLGARLILRRGCADHVIPALVQETGAGQVVWNRCYEPYAIERDTRIKAALKERDIAAESFKGSLLFEPWTVLKADGEPYKVYTPFWKACRAQARLDRPLPAPDALAAPDRWPARVPPSTVT